MTEATYRRNDNPMIEVMVKDDSSLVVVGDYELTEAEAKSMVHWQELEGWTCEL
jgi:hypothetical protein